jgi:hypothetical protein
MGHTAAANDIALVESWGYTRNEAIDLVIRRAMVEERDVEEDGASATDHRAYVDELRGICMAKAG